MIQILYIIPIDSSNLDTSLVIDMSNKFKGCNELKESDLPSCNTSSIIDTCNMF